MGPGGGGMPGEMGGPGMQVQATNNDDEETTDTGESDTAANYMPFYLPLFAIIFSTIMGSLSGLYPALKAQSMPPVIALKYE
jgi:putative ABC transport system permease protein